MASVKQQLRRAHHSIPPTTVEYTMSDLVRVHDNSKNYRGNMRLHRVGFRSCTAPPRPPAKSLPEEFLQRFASRPLTTPKVYGFEKVQLEYMEDTSKRGVTGFFPPIKLRAMDRAHTVHEGAGEDIALGPVANMNLQHRYVKPGTKHSCMHRERTVTIDPPREHPAIYQHVSYSRASPDATHMDDLAYLPKPLRVAPKKDVPWVYRYKVKQSMNQLSQIMASKPSSTSLTSPDVTV